MKIRFASISAASLLLASLANAQVVSVGAQTHAQVQGPFPLVQRSLSSLTTTFHGDSRRSGHYAGWTGPRVASSPWQISLSPSAGFGYAQPVLGANGTVFVKDLADVLYAVSSSGNVLWQVDLGTGSTGGGFPPADSTITIYTEKVAVGGGLFVLKERLFATTGDGQLWKLASNGAVLWNVQMARASSSCSVAVRSNGLIYATSYDLGPPFDGTIGVYDQDGNLVWELDTPSMPAINGAPSLDAQGNVTLNGFNHATKYAQDGGGALYDFTAFFHIYGSIAQDAQGRAFFGAGDGNLYALESDGSMRWALPVGPFVTSTPAVTPNGRVYCGSWDGGVYAADINGNSLWTFYTQGPVESSPIVDKQGYIYFLSTDGLLYCVDPNGQQVFSANVGVNSIGTLAPGNGGRLYATSASGDLMVFVP